MGIRSKAKKIKQLLPIVGAGGNVRASEIKNDRPKPEARPAPPVAPPTPSTPRGDVEPAEFIAAWVKEHPVVLFMKGSPAMPQCGFSASAAGILGTYDVEIAHLDVLIDPELRQGIKDFSKWPTLPQVYIGGEFLGGSDILMQMHENGELGDLIKESMS